MEQRGSDLLTRFCAFGRSCSLGNESTPPWFNNEVVFSDNNRMEVTISRGFLVRAVECGGKEGGAVLCDSSRYHCPIS